MSTKFAGKFNPNYTSDMRFAPVKAGTYSAKLIADPDEDTRWEKRVTKKDGREYYTTRIKAVITEGEYAGRSVYGNVNTLLNKAGGTSVSEVVQACGNGSDLREVDSQEDLCRVADFCLNQEPVVDVVVDWMAPLKRNDGSLDWDKTKRGEVKWPLNSEGEREYIILDEDGTYFARAEVTTFK